MRQYRQIRALLSIDKIHMPHGGRRVQHVLFGPDMLRGDAVVENNRVDKGREPAVAVCKGATPQVELGNNVRLNGKHSGYTPK